MIELKVDSTYEDMRIDRYVIKHITNVSKMTVQKMLRTGRIKLNGRKTKPDVRVKENDCVKIFMPSEDKKQRPPKPTVEMPDILYEENDFIAVNKPAGLLTHPDGKNTDSLTQRIYAYLYDSLDPNETYVPGVVNRLDTNTSGIVLSAKNPYAAKEMYSLMRKNKFKKTYIAFVKGYIDESIHIKGYAQKNNSENRMYPCKEDDRNAIFMHTVITPIEHIDGNTLLKAKLITGKTHQIRYQLFNIGHPLAGDPKYMDDGFNSEMKKRYGLTRQFLHCYEMQFPFWQDQSIIKIQSKYVKDLDYVYHKMKHK